MPELRIDPIIGRRVYVAEDRAGRPSDYVAHEATGRVISSAPSSPAAHPNCPFCAGNEVHTPVAVATVSDASGGWQCRVVPNKYPASPAHEVIIETRDHSAAFHELPMEHAAALVELYAARFEAHRSWPEVLIFKNEGRVAGASMPHPHSQVMALEKASPRRAEEISAGRCRWCEPPPGTGALIARTSSFSVIAPFASAFAYELAIVPQHHEPAIATSPSKAAELARLMQQAVRGICAATEAGGYNWIFHNASKPPFHWYLEITPRLTIPGGFEIATRSSINVVTPEAAADELRSFFKE